MENLASTLTFHSRSMVAGKLGAMVSGSQRF
jgi:hypothetical protein